MGGKSTGGHDLYQKTVEKELDDLAVLTRVPAERLRPVVSATARVALSPRSSRVVFVPSLRTAIDHMSSDDAVTLFESHDPSELAWRELLLKRLKTTEAAHTKADLWLCLNRLAKRLRQHVPISQSIHSPVLANWTSEYGRLFYRGYTNPRAYGPYPSKAPSIPNTLKDRARAAGDAFASLILPVIERLCNGASESRDGAALQDECLDMIRTGLSTDDAGLLLAIDRTMTGYDVFTGLSADDRSLPFAGGLTDLLEIVGHCTEERSVGIFDRTATALGDLIDRRFRDRPRLRVLNLYQAIGCGRESEADCACDTFCFLRNDYVAHWSTYRNQLCDYFQPAYQHYIPTMEPAANRPPTPANLAPLDSFLSPRPPEEVIATLLTRDVQFAFYPCGDFWVIKYDGQCRLLEDHRGFEYLSILFSTPHKDITAVALAQAAGSLSVDERFRDDYGRLQSLASMTDGITEDNSQRLWQDTERIRKSVSAAVIRAKESISKKLPALARHIDNTVYLGHSCRYQPEPAITWRVG